MSANPKVGVGAQVKEILEGTKANSAASVSPSVNAFDMGAKAAP